MKINCLVVDDEPLARKGLEEYVRELEFLHLAGSCSSAASASAKLKEGGVDLLLLDVQMPHLSGIDFLKSLTNPPLVIITTAFSEYALEGFEMEVMDYLLKPIAFARFRKAAEKVRDFMTLKAQAGIALEQNYFFVKSNGKYEKVLLDDILYVEAMQNYVVLVLPGQRLIVYMTLSGMERQLPAHRFMKVHKSYIVALSKVNTIDGHDAVIHSARIPISRNLLEDVRDRVLKGKILKRP